MLDLNELKQNRKIPIEQDVEFILSHLVIDYYPNYLHYIFAGNRVYTYDSTLNTIFILKDFINLNTMQLSIDDKKLFSNLLREYIHGMHYPNIDMTKIFIV